MTFSDLSHLAKYSVTPSIVRSRCDSWVSCWNRPTHTTLFANISQSYGWISSGTFSWTTVYIHRCPSVHLSIEYRQSMVSTLYHWTCRKAKDKTFVVDYTKNVLLSNVQTRTSLATRGRKCHHTICC